MTDLQLETVISQALLPTDQSEFIRDWAKEKSSSVLSSTMIEIGGEEGEDDREEEEELVDFNKTIAGELDMGALEAKREFLMKFLSRKLVELNEILASRRTRNFGRKETTGTAKYVKFKDKTFQMVECPEDVQVTEEIMEENVFLSSVSGNPKSGNVKKNCPLKCGRQHTNGSLFFCQQFRKKEIEERKAIQSKLHNICILCLGWKTVKHECPVRSCPQ